jgi:DNA-binding GntR family transcriptional regulator
MVRPVRREPLAAQVEQILARRLRSGEFHPGDQLPAEHELADDLGVSRSTLRTAIGALSRQGLVVSRHGVGTFVSEASRIANHLTDAIDFHQLIADGGATPSVVFDAAELVPAPASVAAALAIDEGATVHRCAKRFAADGETVVHAVISIATSVLGAELTAAVAADPTITEPLFEFFAHRVGRATEYQLTSLRAVRGAEVPYPGQTFPADAAIIEMEETGFANDNRPIWHSVNWYPPGAMQFELVRRRPPGPT